MEYPLETYLYTPIPSLIFTPRPIEHLNMSANDSYKNLRCLTPNYLRDIDLLLLFHNVREC